MGKFRRAVMWLALALIIIFILLSIYGAFVGAERAEAFFNRVPLAVYWIAFGLLLIIALNVFRRLARVPGLLLMHAGCVFVLAGGMWGSRAGHALQKRLFGIDKIRTGRMIIYEGHRDNKVMQDDKQVKELPFSIGLKDFQIEYYKPAYLYVQSRQGQRWKIPVEIGTEFSLGPEFGTVTILRSFENFKMPIGGDKKTAIDDPRPGYNPALEVQIRGPDGDIATKYAFERSLGHIHRGDKFLLRYQRIIRDYISELQVIENNEVVAEKNIEVNHPLYFGGYHFYQHKYDDQTHQYTVLEVVSDTGLNLVYAGYLMLCIGVFWHLWLRELLSAQIKVRRE